MFVWSKRMMNYHDNLYTGTSLSLFWGYSFTSTVYNISVPYEAKRKYLAISQVPPYLVIYIVYLVRWG